MHKLEDVYVSSTHTNIPSKLLSSSRSDGSYSEDLSSANGLFTYHGELNSQQRKVELEKFRNYTSGGILVCTDIAARGLDIPDVCK